MVFPTHDINFDPLKLTAQIRSQKIHTVRLIRIISFRFPHYRDFTIFNFKNLFPAYFKAFIYNNNNNIHPGFMSLNANYYSSRT